ncbi:MAG TPA: polyprenyl synthetase family protein [Clostridiales bacterium]|jgi:geranylgeranyl diphosphate synthase type II|nr:polyprenyl synthetase family protein [Clostridiales bacterium]HRT81661.1 polyprenyl synthetase family protein [Oscillospiraceae bacterium]
MADYSSKLKNYIALIDKALDGFLPSAEESAVTEAMRYSVENGGKRIRPVLTLAFCELFSGDIHKALNFACAVEMIHAYSLIHDDLPCMDDDDLRRGKPACHIKYGEATALLAGDALLTLAFETLLKSELNPKFAVEGGLLLSKAAGHFGMIGGQVMDMSNEGKTVSLERLVETDNKKTGALISAACRLGCLAADADDRAFAAATVYADNIGLAFQIIDDILDVTGSSQELGKTAGSDLENNKATYVSIGGLDNSKVKADELLADAKASLLPFGESAGFLLWFADFLSERKS